ncbi:ER membrane protein complex subunit 2-like [Zerene cesonia]|uniref:ER membrane protein complex subunit 2-like n=1 Tax=Zerene cesonia TaxID=33412 RepID=UPI0018E4EC95|nr:ER membrane protein complex subunit 2-like [Zerene cesonia]
MADNYEDMSLNEINDLLRKWRDNNERKSTEIMLLWEKANKGLDTKSNEKYLIMEQLIIAALDCNCSAIALIWIEALDAAFPGSLRVLRYKAMWLEAQEQYDKALQVLDQIIKTDETNAPARKRRVAIMKAQGQMTEAIKELVDYLKKFMSDMEAWQELSELYLQMGEYSRAAFCVEELILHQPHNHLFHQRLADIRYTMGGVENMELAKSYYCQAIKLNPNNVRALLGLVLVTNNLLGHYKSSGSAKRKEVWKLCQWAQSEVSKKQKEAQGANANALTNMMLAISISD